MQELDELLASIGRRLDATPRPLLPPPGQARVPMRAVVGP
jgi:hypothetical protein